MCSLAMRMVLFTSFEKNSYEPVETEVRSPKSSKTNLGLDPAPCFHKQKKMIVPDLAAFQ